MSFPLPDFCRREISALTERHKTCQAKLERSPNSEPLREEMKGILKKTCKTIRGLDLDNSILLWDYVDALKVILREGAELDIGEPSVFDILEYLEQYGAPIWVEDTTEVVPERHQDADKWPSIRVGPSISYVGNKVVVEPDKDGYGTEPWKESMKRHPESSPLARFRTNLPTLTSTPIRPLLKSVQDALCEISSLQQPSPPYGQVIKPIKLKISTGSACLALLGTTGAKKQYPWLGYYLLDQDAPHPFAITPDKCFQVGLAEVTSQMAMDETRKLLLVGDKFRVKSFTWGDSRRTFKQALPTHTLDSKRFEGPILTLPNDTILRAGRGAVATWNIDNLETHGPKGSTLVGRRLDIDEYDEELDMCPDIDESSGIPRASHIFFNDEPTLEPDLWERLPDSSAVICAEPYSNSEGCRTCLSIDFEHNGRTVAHFKGHRDNISDISTSSADSRVFLTSCHDGRARLFDIRRSYPVIEFKAGHKYDCQSVALAHPDGIPIVFTGTDRREQIKVWDVRATACIYELATGNNCTNSLAWDAKHDSLFAFTSCSYKDKSGSYTYRQADIPQRQSASHPNNMRQDSNPRCWPRQAWHAEDYFEYAFDAGEDRVYRYTFKEQPDRYVLPEYGKAKEESYTLNNYEEDSYMAYDRDSDDDDDLKDY
ncbi:unnamed protein product [Rhizoctonia solani]|uniref:Uncharacterized protein n=1 Tax=Rhizoctonia solani TaxID=456999 RepID=A0A8H3HE48_9AGAM|nr:unnamed protein product [Rhizoctonia solani]